MNFDFSQFGCNVFSDTVMRDKLPKSTYKELKKSIESSQPLTRCVEETGVPIASALVPVVPPITSV